MMIWVFGIATIIAAGVAATLENTRRSILFLWLAAMLLGCLFLSCECELLAVVQWIVSTAVCLSLMHFSTLLGEYSISWKDEFREKTKLKLIPLLSVPIALGFGLLIAFGEKDLGSAKFLPASLEAVEAVDLHALGRIMVDRHLLSIEVLALTLLAVIIGGGVIARQE